MSKRSVLSLTEHQVRVLNTALRDFMEAGAGGDDASLGKAVEAIRRQVSGDLESAERTSIYETALRLMQQDEIAS